MRVCRLIQYGIQDATKVFKPKITIENLALLNKTFMFIFQCVNMICNEIYTFNSEINSK